MDRHISAGSVGKYGHLMIGTEQAAAEAEAIEVGAVKYGPELIGQEAYDKAMSAWNRAQQGEVDTLEEADAANKLPGIVTGKSARGAQGAPPSEGDGSGDGAGDGVTGPAAGTRTGPPPGVPATPGSVDPRVEQAFLAQLALGEGAATEAYISADEVSAHLDANPAALDRVTTAELNRTPGPRKGVMRDLLSREQARPGGPRPHVVQLLESKL